MLVWLLAAALVACGEPPVDGNAVRSHAPAMSQPADDGPCIISATGIGRSPARYRGARARLMAERAAQIVAARNLLIKLAALQSSPDDGAARHRQRSATGAGCVTRPAGGRGLTTGEGGYVRRSSRPADAQPLVSGRLRGHRYLPTRFRPDGTAEVTVVLTLDRQPSSGAGDPPLHATQTQPASRPCQATGGAEATRSP